MTNIDTLVAIEEIKKLKARYFQCLDVRDWSGWANLFTVDGSYDGTDGFVVRDPATGEAIVDAMADKIAKMRSAGKPVIGRQDLERFGHERLSQIRTVHIGYMPDIEIVSSTHAKAIWGMEDWIFYPAGAPASRAHGIGHYHETYENVAGQWLIKTSKVTRLMLDFIP